MEIKNLGWQSFLLRDKGIGVVLNPYSQKATRTPFPKTKADVVIAFGKKPAGIGKVITGERAPFWVEGPGEYEVRGVEIVGFPGSYWLKLGGIGIAYLAEVEKRSLKMLADDIRQVDIVFLRVDNGNKAKLIVQKLSPSILIPFCFERTDDPENFAWAKNVLDVLDREDVAPIDLLKIDKQQLSEETQVVLLKPKK